MINYRKIWEEYHNQKIPKGYHIHHIDGNHENNDPTNLICVSPEEHWQIHKDQGDPVAVHGKFIQGAGKAGEIGGTWERTEPMPEEQRRKIGESNKRAIKEKYNGIHWRTGAVDSEETRLKKSIATKGENNPMYGKTHSEESVQQISENRKGKTAGENHPMWGKEHSKETKQKISRKAKGRKSPKKGIPEQKHQCPHCGKYANGGNIKRWHGDNCKKKGMG